MRDIGLRLFLFIVMIAGLVELLIHNLGIIFGLILIAVTLEVQLERINDKLEKVIK